MSSYMVLLSLGLLSCAQAQRNVVATLGVGNAGTWGDWHTAEFCPSKTYANGFRLKVEGSCGSCDDTALNGIELSCNRKNSDEFQGTISSHVGPWGDWTGYKSCLRVGRIVLFHSSFMLRVEGKQGKGDDTAANNIKMKCRELDQTDDYEIEGDGGVWGSWGGWSGDCPPGSAICGVKTKIERPLGSGDDTALNDIEFYCCND